jgi:hypothetical protein
LSGELELGRKTGDRKVGVDLLVGKARAFVVI